MSPTLASKAPPTSPAASRLARAQRSLVLAALLALAVNLSGCVYLRLLSFKKQLKEFDAHVEVVSTQGLALVLKEPVLLDSDFLFITESRPTRIETLRTEPRVEEWVWRFEKERKVDSALPFQIDFVTRFERNQLTRIVFDPKLLEVMPSEFVVELFRSLGKARINQLRRSATASMSGADLEGVPLPSLSDIDRVVGEPTRAVEQRQRVAWHYTFNFRNPDTGAVAGQFRLAFRSRSRDWADPISGFEVTGKAR